ncbi:MAG: type VI secretion system contractile sheath large subunit [Planctomycetota bacterium]|nr:type VI secretion system contractile sheath large subunit [Planctomycetota bacterium]
MSTGVNPSEHFAIHEVEQQDETVATTALTAPSLLDSLRVSAGKGAATGDSRLDLFLREPSPARAIRLWLGASADLDKEQLVRRLNREVAVLDQLLNQQLNAILHQAAFQQLEASWRGLHYLVERVDEEGQRNIKIRVLNASWRELDRDFERAIEFDQSHMFRKIYEDEFGQPGGEPYSVLLGDFEIRPRPAPGHPHDDLALLASFAQVAAAAFCPFVAAASPSMFGLDNFGGLEYQLDHAQTLQSLDYLKWNALRKTEDARFVGLALPRVLMRLPYEDDGTRVDRFCFREEVSGPDRSKYLWGNAAYAFGGVLIRAFAETGWLADIRGVQQDVEGGGLVTELAAHSFGTDKRGVALKASTDVVVTDVLERDLNQLGFLPLCDCQGTEFSAFYSSPSIQQPRKYDRAAATANARLSAMLPYVLCVSRFAHYLKVLGRDRTGAFSEPGELEQFLQSWIMRYVTSDSEASPEVKAKFPLREAKVEVRADPGKPGSYQCVMHLTPHYALDELAATVRLATELSPPRGA